MIAIIDYGVGNIFSLKRSFEFIGVDTILTRDPEELKKADKIILPGVGAFGDAIDKLRGTGLIDDIKAEAAAGKPFLGICLGMQLLLDKGYEYGVHDGLSFIPGEARDMKEFLTDSSLKTPEMGWNSLEFPKDKPKHALFKYIDEGEYVYFVHSFCGVNCEENTIATVDYSFPVTAGIAKDNVMGLQFHPEKSGDTGLRILKAFSEL